MKFYMSIIVNLKIIEFIDSFILSFRYISNNRIYEMAFINACISDSSAPYREVKKVQFGILSPDEIVIQTYAYV